MTYEIANPLRWAISLCDACLNRGGATCYSCIFNADLVESYRAELTRAISRIELLEGLEATDTKEES